MSLTRQQALETLGFSKQDTPSVSDIRSAYLRAAIATHSDKHFSDKGGETKKHDEAFIEVQAAYRLLSSSTASPKPAQTMPLLQSECCVHVFVTRWLGLGLAQSALTKDLSNTFTEAKNQKYDEQLKTKAAIRPEAGKYLRLSENEIIGIQDWACGYHCYFKSFDDAVQWLSLPANIRFQHYTDAGANNNYPLVYLVDKKAGAIVDVYSGGPCFQNTANLYHLPSLDMRHLEKIENIKEKSQVAEAIRMQDYALLNDEEPEREDKSSDKNNFIQVLFKAKNILRDSTQPDQIKHQRITRLAQENHLSEPQIQKLKTVVSSEMLLISPEYKTCEDLVTSFKKKPETVQKSEEMDELLTLLRVNGKAREIFLSIKLADVALANKEKKAVSVLAHRYLGLAELDDIHARQQLTSLIQSVTVARPRSIGFLTAKKATDTNSYDKLQQLQEAASNVGGKLFALTATTQKLITDQSAPVKTR